MEAIRGQAGMRRLFSISAALALTRASFAATASQASPRERLSLDRGWLFHLGDIAPPEIKDGDASYNNAKAGNAAGAAGTTYDDSGWRTLHLPHDWAVEAPFDPKGNSAQGYRPRGAGWYRRYLRIDPSERGRHMELQFDAIATHATVWVNGNVVHRNWSGYNASHIDITPYLRYGDAGNTIAIRADATPMEGWWYEGAGIYRHVGVAVPGAIWEYRLRRLKELGVKCDPLLAQRSGARSDGHGRPHGLFGDGREPQLQSLARLHVAA